MESFNEYYERQNYMQSLRGEVRTPIEKYFEEKLYSASLPDSIDNDLWDMVEETIDKIHDMLHELDRNIDNNIKDFDRKQEIENIRDDIKTQDYLERDLFKGAV